MALVVAPRPPRSPLFPYTTLFRSLAALVGALDPLVAAESERLGQAFDARVEAGAELDRLRPGRGRGEPFGEPACGRADEPALLDRKSTRLNSSHMSISYAVFCLKK